MTRKQKLSRRCYAQAEPKELRSEQIAQIEAARARGKAQAAVRPRDEKGRLLPKNASPSQDGPKPKRRNAGKKASRRDVARAGRKAVAITKTMGAPTYYQQENITAILDAIAAGASLTKACQQLGIPWKTVWNWRTRHPDFRAAYDRAVQERAHAQAEQIIDIADDDTCDIVERKSKDGATHLVQNTGRVQRDRLRIQARQWLMGKAQPEKYGDIKTIRDERHPLDLMTEEEQLAATLELVEKVKARLAQARALGLLPPKVETTDAEFEE